MNEPQASNEPTGGHLRLSLEPASSRGGNLELCIISQPIVIGRSAPDHSERPPPVEDGADTAAPSLGAPQRVNGHWILLATAQTTQDVRQRVSLATDQLGYSLRRLYASASSIANDVPPAYHNIPGIVPYYHGRSSGPPPSYDDVMNPYAPPPTYQSLFGQMLEARKSSRGLVDLLRRLLILSTLGCSLLIACMILIPFTMIIVGAIYLGDCRVEHLPAFLLVGGLVWASKNILHCWSQCKQSPEPMDLNEYLAADSVTPSAQQTDTQTGNSASAQPNAQQGTLNQPNQNQRIRRSICESLLNCLLFAWFIVGCILVFRNYEPDFVDQQSPRYCNRTVYLYTFWLISSAIILLGLFVSCICCLMVSSAMAAHHDDDLA